MSGPGISAAHLIFQRAQIDLIAVMAIDLIAVMAIDLIAVMASLEGFEDYIREKVEKDRMTFAQLCSHMQGLYPGIRGFSLQFLERFCSNKGIHKTARPSDGQLDDAAVHAIVQVS